MEGFQGSEEKQRPLHCSGESHSSPPLHPAEPTAALKLVNHSHAPLEGAATVTQPYLLGSLWLQITTTKNTRLP